MDTLRPGDYDVVILLYSRGCLSCYTGKLLWYGSDGTTELDLYKTS